MDIRELRESTGMSRAAFAKEFGIPYRTLEDWEAGRRKAAQPGQGIHGKIGAIIAFQVGQGLLDAAALFVQLPAVGIPGKLAQEF